jgi:hypothetical protein
MVVTFIVMVDGKNGVIAWKSNANLKIVHQCAHGHAIRHNATRNVVLSAISLRAPRVVKVSTLTAVK